MISRASAGLALQFWARVLASRSFWLAACCDPEAFFSHLPGRFLDRARALSCALPRTAYGQEEVLHVILPQLGRIPLAIREGILIDEQSMSSACQAERPMT
jgi:hypothetical protein